MASQSAIEQASGPQPVSTAVLPADTACQEGGGFQVLEALLGSGPRLPGPALCLFVPPPPSHSSNPVPPMPHLALKSTPLKVTDSLPPLCTVTAVEREASQPQLPIGQAWHPLHSDLYLVLSYRPPGHA